MYLFKATHRCGRVLGPAIGVLPRVPPSFQGLKSWRRRRCSPRLRLFQLTAGRSSLYPRTEVLSSLLVSPWGLLSASRGCLSISSSQCGCLLSSWRKQGHFSCPGPPVFQTSHFFCHWPEKNALLLRVSPDKIRFPQLIYIL